MAALLSVALLPIGLVAVVQTKNVAAQAESSARLALLALTEQAASRERMVLSNARGTAAAVGAILPGVADDPARCGALMRDVQTQSETFSLVAFLPASGLLTCSSGTDTFDFSGTEEFERVMADPRPNVTVNRDAPLSRTSVIIVSSPVWEGADGSGAFLGYVTLSIPHLALDVMGGVNVADSMVDLVTFNDQGDILTTGQGLTEAEANLPDGVTLTDIIQRGQKTLLAEDRTGADRIYTLATIEPGQVFALGVWDRTRSIAGRTGGELLTSFFPALMWIAGLVVALLAVHRLVIQHLEVLGRQMALFTAARRLPARIEGKDAPTEIRRIQQAFHRMTDALIRDEASLEDAVREKSVLVKEIHHRVKNNLQLISSIINMQIRSADGAEAKASLRQTQDRVLSMATIHRDLYQTNESGLVDVGHLVKEVVGKTIEMLPDVQSMDVKLDVEDVWLFPDQAVPMSLLASEAVINALKHMPTAEEADGPRYLHISLTRAEDRSCVFRAENAAGPGRGSDVPSKGMGRKLIQAFATQLGAKVETVEEDGAFRLLVTFVASEFAPAPGTF